MADEHVIMGYTAGAALANTRSKAVCTQIPPGEIMSQASLVSQTFDVVNGSPEIPLIFLHPHDGCIY